MEQLEELVRTRQVTIAEQKKGNKMKRKKISLVVVTFLVLCMAVFYMQKPLVKKGYAMSDKSGKIDLQAEINNQKITKGSKEGFYRFFLPTKLNLTNNQDKPLLVIRKAVHIIGVKMAESESNLKNGIYIENNVALPGFKQKDLLDLQVLVQDTTETISPSKSYGWSDEYWFTFSEKESDNLTTSEISLEKLRTLDSLWIEFEVAFFPLNTMSDEGNKLKDNWENKGNLLIDTLTTKPIEISIPQEIDSCTKAS